MAALGFFEEVSSQVSGAIVYRVVLHRPKCCKSANLAALFRGREGAAHPEGTDLPMYGTGSTVVLKQVD